ncbi:MAG: IS256 family transposase [Bacilli bacterium]|nr:IS256 family transposase [Bacilli bacterium]
MRSKNKSKNELVQAIIDTYQPETAKDVQDALKDIFGPMFEAMLQGEMNSHLGYENNDKREKETENRRNGYITKNVKTSMGEMQIDVPRDRDGSFEPQIIPKRTKDISDIDKKVLSMYAKGMSQRDISSTIEDIYGFKISHETISDITDCVIEELNEWQSRPLKKCYPFVFVDCMYVTMRYEYESSESAVYTILGYDINGHKDILGIWLNETESKHSWMQIFDEIKARGVEDIFFISMDGVSGLEDGAKEIFKNVVVQRCIVHLIRNSLKYVPSKDYKKYTANLKLVYGAPNLKTAQVEFEKLKNTWSKYTGAIDVWERNFKHVEQLFDYPSAIRKIMYTTNAIEAINSSFRKVTKKGAFPNENALFKLLYLRVTELYKKWDDSTIANWAMVRNQLDAHPMFQERFRKYAS